MVQFKVGDSIVVCASITEFCGTSTQVYYLYDINTSLAPCTIKKSTPGTCLPMSGVQLEFQWANPSGSVDDKQCTAATKLKTLGAASTDSQGVASVSYTITQDDLNLYNTNISQFDLRVCILNSNVTADYSDVRHNFQTDLISIATEQATHVIDVVITPHSWYTPQGAVDFLISKINDINGAVLNWISPLTGWEYVRTDITHDGTYVHIKIFVKDTTLQASPPFQINTLALPALTAGNLAAVAVVILVISIGVGVLKNVLFGPTSQPVNAGLTNGDLGTAGNVYIKKQVSDCETIVCADPSLTQDQKAQCIKNCIDSELTNWKDYQNTLLPEANHGSIDTGKTEVQTCYDAYLNSIRSASDYQALLNCMKSKSTTAIDTDKGTTDKIYPPDAKAGLTASDVAGQCWIPGLSNTCLLSASTGKTIVLIGGLAIGGYIAFKLLRR